MKILPVIALLFITACGADDSSSSSEASTDLKPSLWTQEELYLNIEACMNELPEFPTSSASAYCNCWLGPISQKYEYEIVDANVTEILEREMPLLEECAEKYLQ